MKLLIVDDEIIAIQGLLNDINKEYVGIQQILTANCYAEALNIFTKEKIDILLCDIEMPFGTGLDLVEWVKKYNPECECIFLTCHDEFSFAKQAISLKCLDYILKPVSTQMINDVLQKAVTGIHFKKKEQVYRDYGKIFFSNMMENKSSNGNYSGNAVEKAEEYIAMNIANELSVEEIAGKVFLSSGHLSRLFKKKHNMTVTDYITQQRMKVAKELIETTDMSVTMISACCGYSNYSYFIKMFKKTYGKTPRVFRAEKK